MNVGKGHRMKVIADTLHPGVYVVEWHDSNEHKAIVISTSAGLVCTLCCRDDCSHCQVAKTEQERGRKN